LEANRTGSSSLLRRCRDVALRKLGSNGDLILLYNKWFVSRLLTGEKLNVEISPQLEEAFKVLNDSEGTSN
jgi:glutamate/aspartate transport system substrate-binding protein